MDNNFYDELKKFLNNIENPFRPEGDIFTVKILTSQNGCHKNDASEINHNNFSLVATTSPLCQAFHDTILKQKKEPNFR